MSFSSRPSSGVTWVPSGSGVRTSRTAGANPTSAERVGAWIVMMLLFACVAVAVFDLYVLLGHLR